MSLYDTRLKERRVRIDSWTVVAHFLCTSPEYQRKGFATRLLKVGLDRADDEGRRTYIDASPDGWVHLYFHTILILQ